MSTAITVPSSLTLRGNASVFSPHGHLYSSRLRIAAQIVQRLSRYPVNADLYLRQFVRHGSLETRTLRPLRFGRSWACPAVIDALYARAARIALICGRAFAIARFSLVLPAPALTLHRVPASWPRLQSLLQPPCLTREAQIMEDRQPAKMTGYLTWDFLEKPDSAGHRQSPSESNKAPARTAAELFPPVLKTQLPAIFCSAPK